MRLLWASLGVSGFFAASSAAAVIPVNCPADDLQAKIDAASPGDTLQVSGPCDGGEAGFRIAKSISLVAPGGPASASLSATSPTGAAVQILASHVSLDGLTVRGPGSGVSVCASVFSRGYCWQYATPIPTVTGVTIQNVRVTPSGTPDEGGVGLGLENVEDAVVDRCVIDDAGSAGIRVRGTRVTVMNSSARLPNPSPWRLGMELGIEDSQVTGNHATGIRIYGRNNNYVGQNEASDIVVAGSSAPRSFLGSNTLAGNRTEQQGIAVGTMNRGTCILGNDAAGGIALSEARSSLVFGNRVHGASGAGVSLGGMNYTYLPPLNLEHHVRRNHLTGNTGPQVQSVGTQQGDIAFNFIDGGTAQAAGVGVELKWNFPPPGSLNFRSAPTAGYRLFSNTFRDVRIRCTAALSTSGSSASAT